MRKAGFLLIALGCLACFSCHPDKCCVMPGPKNYIRAQRADTNWLVLNPSGYVRSDTLLIADTSVNPHQSELLVFKLKFTGKGDYALTPNNAIYGYAPQMDNPYVYYTLDTSFANTFQVFFYEGPGGYIDGNFNIKLNKKPENTDTRYPQSITFLSGVYHFQLSK